MGFFNDTSGLGASESSGSTNNAAADFTRQSADNPRQFDTTALDRLFGRSKASAGASNTPTPSPGAPMASPQPAAAATASPAPAISSGGSLVGRVLRAASGPPSYNAQGEALVPGTTFTPQQFAQQLLASAPAHQQPFMGLHNTPYPGATPTPPLSSIPAFQGIPQFPNPQPPQRQVPPTGAGSWFGPPAAAGPSGPIGGNRFGGNTFGGNRFGGNTFGGYRFGQGTAPPPGYDGVPPSPPADSMSFIPPQLRLQMLAQRQQNMSPAGFFRGGDVQAFRRGGLPHLMMGLPERMAHGGGSEGYVPPDGQGDGRSDHVDAKLSPGEFVVDAETVSLLGNGDNSAGARELEKMREGIRKQKGKALAKGHFSTDSKPASAYLKGEK